MSNNSIAKKYLDCFAQIEAREDLRPYITQEILFKRSGTTRIIFEVEVDGKKVAYVATPDDVLRHKRTIGKKQILVDDLTGNTIRETINPNTPNEFSRVYRNPRGRIVRKSAYEFGTQMYEGSYNPETGHLINETVHSYTTRERIRTETSYDKNGEQIDSRSYKKDGRLYSIHHPEYTEIYDGGETPKVRAYKRMTESGEEYYEPVMILDSGEEMGTLQFERQKNPDLTDDEYLDILKDNLTSWEDFQMFFENLVHYLHDDPAKRDATYQTPNIGEDTDYWQLPEETINRVEKGTMLGDCDDYAFLAREILRRQDKPAFVVSIPKHAICVHVNQRPDGRYDAVTVGTYGVDINGNRLGMPVDPEKERGYETVREALQSVMAKYDEADLGMEEGREVIVEDKVKILDIPSQGESSWKDVPLEFLAEPMFLQIEEAKAGNNTLMEGSDNPDQSVEAIYRKLIDKYPDNNDYKKDLAQLYIAYDFYPKAEEIYRQLIEEDPANSQEYKKKIATMYRIIVLRSSLEPDVELDRNALQKSVETFEELAAEGMDDEAVYNNLLNMYSEHYEDSPEKMNALLENIWRNFDNLSYDTLIRTASTLGNIDMPAESLKIHRELFNTRPHTELDWYFFISYADKLSEPEEKEKVLRAGLALHPDSGAMQSMLEKIQ